MELTTWLIGLVAMCFLYILFKSRRPKNYPPGPTGIPILGYAPFLGTDAAQKLAAMKETYGSVMRIQMGRDDWIVLQDYDAINEAFVKQGEVFSGRPKHVVFEELSDGGKGVALADYGSTWKNLRKFGLTTLRGFGVGKKGMEANVIEETSYLVENLTTKNDMSLLLKLMTATSNVISRVVFGHRFGQGDPRQQKLIEVLLLLVEDTPEKKAGDFFVFAPILRHFPILKETYKNILTKVGDLMAIINDIKEQHKSSYDANDIRDFFDAFLKEKEANPRNEDFSERQLIQYARDLLDGGTSTTAAVLHWMIFCIASYPEVQDRIVKEIENTFGFSGVSSMKHREQMPYTCAFIEEIMRLKTIVPLGLVHKTNKDAKLRGYDIPKNTTIISNAWAVHLDPELFEDPEVFRPERFLDVDGKFIKSKHVIPFGLGPRRCLGEQLAIMEVFIFLVSIVQKLNVLPDLAHPLPPFKDGTFSAQIYSPPDFKVLFESR